MRQKKYNNRPINFIRHVRPNLKDNTVKDEIVS